MESAKGSAGQRRRKAPECERCFKRRIKCDGKRPECQKCVSKGLKCPGVLDEFDLKFRDQSQVVKKKVAKQSANAPTSSSDTKSKKTPRLGSNARSSAEAEDDPRIVESWTTRDEQAIFRTRPSQRGTAIQTSVNLPPGVFTMGLFLDGHPNMLGSSGAADPWIAYLKPAIDRSGSISPLRLAAEAISLAVFAQGGCRPDVNVFALQRYTQCISALRKAIADPVEAAADDTINTVLLLTVYEYVTSNDDRGKERFIHHTDGVIAIAVYRRKRGSASYQQMQMFWVIITSMVMRYTYIGRSRFLRNNSTPQVMANPQGKVTIPKQAKVRDWISGLRASDDSPASRLFELMIGSLLLRTKSLDLHLLPAAVSYERTDQVRELFVASVKMNKMLEHWKMTLPLASQPTEHNAFYHLSEEDVDTAEIWPGSLITFEDLQAASTYCQWRWLKIMVLCVALRNLHWLRLYAHTTEHEAEFNKMREELYEQVDGLCASVPFFIGVKRPLPAELAHSDLSRVGLDGRAALSIAVMLQIAILIEGLPRLQRQWIKARLKYISQDIGIKYAHVGYQNEAPTLIFGGDPFLTQTFGGRESQALSASSMSVRLFLTSSSPALSTASLSTTSTLDSRGSHGSTQSCHHEAN